MTFKALVRLLNFILFLLAVSFLTSQGSHAASVDVSSDSHQVSNQTETNTIHQSTTISVDGATGSDQKALIQTSQTVDTKNNTDKSPAVTIDSQTPTIGQLAGVAGAAAVTNTKDTGAPLAAKSPTKPTARTYIRTAAHSASSHVSQPVVSISNPATTNHTPSFPVTPSETNVLNATSLIFPIALVKQMMYEVTNIPHNVDYTILAQLIAAIAVFTLGVLVSSVLFTWLRKGFAQVVSPRGQTVGKLVFAYQNNLRERHIIRHSSLFSTYGGPM